MHESIFREYDIRGKVASEIKLDEVYNLGRAIVYFFVSKNPAVKKIVIGMDGRNHSPEIKKELTRAIIDSGLDVLFVGLVPTPVVYFALHTQPVQAGLMITASHNPKEYNGIKICLGTESVWGKEITQIGTLYKEKKHIETKKKGTYQEQNLIPLYIDYLADHFSPLQNMQLSAVIDCGNAVGGTVLPELVIKMNWPNVQLLYCDVDGNYPNHEADPVVEKNMADVKKILQTTNVEVGIGLDGDCDRMAAMTKSGFLIPGDQLLAIFARPVLKKFPNTGVVFDINASSGLVELLEQWGAIPYMSPCGHAIIKEHMKKTGSLLGGELSCHFFFHDRYFGFDDAIYAMMRLFEILVKSKKSLDELTSLFPKKYSTQQFRIPCPEDTKRAIIQRAKEFFSKKKDVKLITIDGVRVNADYGWGLLRASNTQPVICLRFESDTQQGLQKIMHEFIQALQNDFDPNFLKDQLNL